MTAGTRRPRRKRKEETDCECRLLGLSRANDTQTTRDNQRLSAVLLSGKASALNKDGISREKVGQGEGKQGRGTGRA